jgi:tetratricopeptide (TPR) repeat protein
MGLRDQQGNAMSTTSAGAAAAYDQATELYLRYSASALAPIEAALQREPDFVAGHAFKAAVLAMTTERALEPDLRAAVEAAERLAPAANERERAHTAAARAWLDGDLDGALARWGRIALDHPRDLLALQTAHLGDFYLGRQTELRDRLAQALHAWDDRAAGHGYLLGMYAFGLEETGDYARAEDLGRRAVELDRRDAWAAHAVAHVMEMQARLDEGIGWLAELSGRWDADCGFSFHNHWHLALYLLDAGDVERALALYDRRIRPTESGVVLEMVDASALLWRLHLDGHDVRERAARLADAWAPRTGDGLYVFNDAHAIMAFLAAGRTDAARACLAEVERHAGDAGTNGAMIREVGLPVCRALVALAERRHAQAVELLLPVRATAMRFGGSNAQRDALSLTLLEAALGAGSVAAARGLASERTRLRPANPRGWALAARALDLAGDQIQAASARAQAARLRARFAASLAQADRVIAAGAAPAVAGG